MFNNISLTQQAGIFILRSPTYQRLSNKRKRNDHVLFIFPACHKNHDAEKQGGLPAHCHQLRIAQ